MQAITKIIGVATAGTNLFTFPAPKNIDQLQHLIGLSWLTQVSEIDDTKVAARIFARLYYGGDFAAGISLAEGNSDGCYNWQGKIPFYSPWVLYTGVNNATAGIKIYLAILTADGGEV